ncbi:MAG: hypothetical protein IPM64_06185 [Phycisphaerales bacterium]|nr:hypothetical protein [Phycisphaerales bacterium]
MYARTASFCVMLIALSTTPSASAGGDYGLSVDLFQIGDRTFLRTEFQLEGMGQFIFGLSPYLHGESWGVTYFDAIQFTTTGHFRVRRYSPWGAPELPETEADFTGVWPNAIGTLSTNSDVWALWSDIDGTWARRVSHEGAVHPDRMTISTTLRYAASITGASYGGDVAVALESWDESPVGTFIGWFNTQGDATVPFQTLPLNPAPHQLHGIPSVAVNANGDFLATYALLIPVPHRRVEARTVLPGGAMGAPVVVGPPLSDRPSVGATGEGSFLVFARRSDGTPPATVQRVSPDGLPLWQAIPADHRAPAFAALPDGGFVSLLGYMPGTGGWPMSLVMFDSVGVPLSAPLTFTKNSFNYYSLATDGRNVMVAPSGTVWIVWQTILDNQYEYFVTSLRPYAPGDLDGDGRLTNFDIDPFVLALTNRQAYQAAFPHIPPEAIDILGDMDGDGVLTNFDIDPFVDALVNGP